MPTAGSFKDGEISSSSKFGPNLRNTIGFQVYQEFIPLLDTRVLVTNLLVGKTKLDIHYGIEV